MLNNQCLSLLRNIVGRQLNIAKSEEIIEVFTNDVIDDWIPKLKQGILGLLKRKTNESKENGMADLFDPQ